MLEKLVSNTPPDRVKIILPSDGVTGAASSPRTVERRCSAGSHQWDAMLCVGCGFPHGLTELDAGTDREYARLCPACFVSQNAELSGGEAVRSDDLLDSFPPKPNPPLCRYIRSDEFLIGAGRCKCCGSTVMRKYIFFGSKRCIHPLCKSNNNMSGGE